MFYRIHHIPQILLLQITTFVENWKTVYEENTSNPWSTSKLVKTSLSQFLEEKDQTFFELGIFDLAERWQEIVKKNGQYITD